MCCLALSAGFIGPRFALLLWWIFGDKVDAAFSSWIWPLLGLLFLPWTTLAYVLAWGPINDVSGLGWLVVALGLVRWTSRRTRPARPKRATRSSSDLVAWQPREDDHVEPAVAVLPVGAQHALAPEARALGEP